MAVVAIRRSSDLPAAEAWRRLTLWEGHGAVVPFTTVRRVPGSRDGVGARFVARTGFGRVGFDDPMHVTVWQPPEGDRAGFCRIEKEGTVVRGWAELTVTPTAGGSDVLWREDAVVGGPRVLAGPSAWLSRPLFGRVVSRLLAGS